MSRGWGNTCVMGFKVMISQGIAIFVNGFLRIGAGSCGAVEG